MLDPPLDLSRRSFTARQRSRKRITNSTLRSRLRRTVSSRSSLASANRIRGDLWQLSVNQMPIDAKTTAFITVRTAKPDDAAAFGVRTSTTHRVAAGKAA